MSYVIVSPAGFSIVLVFWAALCAAQDLWQRRVSNVLTLGMMAFALCALLVSGQSLTGQGLLPAFLALGLAMLLTLPGYVLGLLGAADAKMLMAFGLASGVTDVLEVFVVAGLSSAFLMLLARRLEQFPVFARLMTSSGPLLHVTPRNGKTFPFALCLAMGVVVSQCLLLR